MEKNSRGKLLNFSFNTKGEELSGFALTTDVDLSTGANKQQKPTNPLKSHFMMKIGCLRR